MFFITLNVLGPRVSIARMTPITIHAQYGSCYCLVSMVRSFESCTKDYHVYLSCDSFNTPLHPRCIILRSRSALGIFFYENSIGGQAQTFPFSVLRIKLDPFLAELFSHDPRKKLPSFFFKRTHHNTLNCSKYTEGESVQEYFKFSCFCCSLASKPFLKIL